MDRAVFVYTTFPSLVEAEAAAKVIVEQKLAAQCRRFEIPAPPAASPPQEFQIEKRHWNHMFASALMVFEVRVRSCRAVSRTSKTGH